MKKIQELRKQLHQHPELSGHETQTAARICSFLEEHTSANLLKGIGGEGVAAVFECSDSGPVLLFRCELDALPIEEPNAFPHRSSVKGVSHKCGHDGHMAIVAGLGLWLEQQDLGQGKVILLFQPAEETGAGAAAVLEDPRFRALKPDYCFALHNLPGEPLHQIIKIDGYFSATVQSVAIYLQGKQSHASEPEKGINPALGLAELVQQLAFCTVPEPEREDFALLTPVHLKLGELAYGISAGSGELHYTLRTWTEEEMERLKKRLLKAVESICHKHQLTYSTDWFDYFPATRNDSRNNSFIEKAAAAKGFDLKERPQPYKFGEDFSWFSREYSSAMFGLGAGTTSPALHHADYDFPDELLETGIRMFAGIVEGILK